jgi:TonB family protein
MPVTPLQVSSEIPLHIQLDVLDSRIAVPVDARPARLTMAAPLDVRAMREVVEPDVLTTGEANLLIDVEEEKLPIVSWIPRWVAPAGTAAVHVAIIAFAIVWPKLFPPRVPTQREIEMAARSLGMIYIPPEVENVPRIAPPPQSQSPRIRIDPRILRELIPNQTPSPLPGAPQPPAVQPREQAQLPDAPRPQSQQGDSNGSGAQRAEEPGAPRFENPKPLQSPSASLILPKMSPGRALEESARGATQAPSSAPNIGFGRRSTGGSMGSPGGGGGQGYLDGALQMLTPTEGVDFSNYLARVLASIKRNWYAVMPESATMGERGRVILQFRILRDGSVPSLEPRLMVTSTKEHLDRAAMSSVRASNPFEPLPQAFSGPFIELRIMYLYNLPLDYRE